MQLQTLPLHCKPCHVSQCPRRSPPSATSTRFSTYQRSRQYAQPEASGDQLSASQPEAGGAAAGPFSVLEEAIDPEERTDASTDGDDQQVGRRRRPAGYTPFEYITFGESRLTHELTIEVPACPYKRPVGPCNSFLSPNDDGCTVFGGAGAASSDYDIGSRRRSVQKVMHSYFCHFTFIAQ